MKRAVRGVELAYDDTGSGPALVLLHPFPFDRSIWTGNLPALAESWRVISVDFRGCGESALVAPYSISDLADDVAGLLGELGIAQAVLMGLSMGGYVALAFAAQRPELLRGLVLADTRAAPDSPEARKGRDGAIRFIRSDGVEAFLEKFVPRLLSPSTNAEIQTQARDMAEKKPGALIAALEAMRDRPDRTPELGAIRCPTLVVVGAEDRVTPPAEANGIAQAIPGARLALIQRAGHLAHLEGRQEFNRTVLEFLDGLPAAPKA